jgi:hypothetical protein
LFKPPSLAQVRFFIEKPDVYDAEFTGSENISFGYRYKNPSVKLKNFIFDWMIVF